MSVALTYNLLVRNIERSLAITAAQGPVKLESKYFLEQLAKITSIDDFLADTRVFTFAMTAFGLEDFAFAKGYMRKILEEGVSEPTSLANRTTDPKIQEFARVFDFETFGAVTMQRQEAGQAIVDRYVRQKLETQAGELDGEGVRLALYFERMAATVETPYDILADTALSKVVRVALGIPGASAAADIDLQAKAIEQRLDIADFQDPAKVRGFLTRFTALWDATEGAASDPILSLFGVGSSSMPTISLDLALSVSSFRLGGR